MDQVPLKDIPAPDSVLSVAELNRIDKAEGRLIPGVSPDDEIFTCVVRVDPGLSGAQLTAIKTAMVAIPNVQIVRAPLRMVARSAANMPPDTLISIAVEACWKYAEPVDPE
jgi:hypothetical protein